MMALVVSSLKSALQSILDPEYVNFKSYPDNAVAVAFRWMEAIHSKYAGKNLFPPVNPELADAAGEILWASLLEFGRERQPHEQVPADLLEKSIQAYAVAMSAAIAPPFVGTPPAGNLDLSPAYDAGRAGNNAAVALLLSILIHEYLVTGTAVNQASGLTVNWA